MGYKLDYTEYEKTLKKVIAEGHILLRNEDNALPIEKGRVALFGRMQNHYYRSGSGSGGMVNTPVVYSFVDAFKDEKEITLDEELLQTYIDWEKENPYKNNKGYSMEYWSQDEMPVSTEMAEYYAKKNDAAVVIIARTAGEDRDNSGEEGSFKLQKEEEMLLDSVTKAFSRTIIILNIGNVMDFGFIEKYKPEAVLLAWQGGMLGVYGTLDVICGRENPSGHLPDSIAKDITDYPAYEFFGDTKRNFYKEDIYVGYRYFETFAKDRVIYPFGFGLSYTDFLVETKSAKRIEKGTELVFEVTNTGKRAGLETIQIYVEAPQGKLGKAARVLAGFKKTKELKPGEKEEIKICVDDETFASYDDAGIVISDGTGFVLEAGKYKIYAGENVRDAIEVYSFNLEKDVIVSKLDSAMKPFLSYDRMRPEKDGETYKVAWENVPLRNSDAVRKNAPELPYTPDKKIIFKDVAEGKASVEEFMMTLSDEDLCCIVRGEGMRSEKVTPGTASAIGGVNNHLKSLGVPCGCLDDGPSGMRLDSGVYAMSLPNGTMMASTFNPDLVGELFTFLAIEMRKNKVDVILGPGMNIHRHPYNGRNFEYFSEDPLLSGRMAVAQIKSLQTVGVDGVPKHFCGNNQETERFILDSVISERALREIYLKGFEIAVKEAKVHFIMTTYGRVNGLWTSNDYELTQMILRDQWGFDGMVMTDWWAAINEEGRMDEPGIKGSKTNFKSMIKARNDCYMVCADSSVNEGLDNLMDSLGDGSLTRSELAICAGNVLKALLRIPAIETVTGDIKEVEVVNRPEYWKVKMENAKKAYEVGEKIEVDITDIELARGESYPFCVRFDKPGIYEVELAVKCGIPRNVLVPASILINEVPEMLFNFHVGDDSIFRERCVINVNDKEQLWRLFFSHDGLKCISLNITRIENI